MAKKYRFFVLSLFVSMTWVAPVFGQNKTSKIDYSKQSNFINPDTLKGDQKALFYHFVNLTSEEVMTKYTPDQLKAEFKKLGLIPEEKERFFEAYLFYSTTMEGHKQSCEQWESFKYLDPNNPD